MEQVRLEETALRRVGAPEVGEEFYEEYQLYEQRRGVVPVQQFKGVVDHYEGEDGDDRDEFGDVRGDEIPEAFGEAEAHAEINGEDGPNDMIDDEDKKGLFFGMKIKRAQRHEREEGK